MISLILLILLIAALVAYTGVTYRVIKVLEWMDTDEFRSNDMRNAPAFVTLVAVEEEHDHVLKTVEGYLHAHCAWSFPWTFTCTYHNPSGGGSGSGNVH